MAAKKATRELPKPVKASDLKYDYKSKIPYDKLREMNVPSSLTLYKTKNLGWVVTTLHISNASSRNKAAGVSTARTYAIGMSDKKIYTVGRGPHVEDEITVFLNEDNVERLTPLMELYVKGLTDASVIRDRTSSRRAMGALNRANGKTSWMW